jgi:hypothetical protein
MKTTILLLSLFTIISSSRSQTVDKIIFTEFAYDRRVILQKIVTNNTDTTFFIGLSITRNTVKSEEFMDSGSAIFLENGIVLEFEDQTFINYLYSGQHQIAVKHKLNQDEISLLLAKTLVRYTIHSYEFIPDRFSKKELAAALLKLVNKKS